MRIDASRPHVLLAKMAPAAASKTGAQAPPPCKKEIRLLKQNFFDVVERFYRDRRCSYVILWQSSGLHRFRQAPEVVRPFPAHNGRVIWITNRRFVL
jgi:hypothetical protein